MKTVTICGSMKFETEMQRIAFLLETKHNMNVLQCVYNVDNLDITPMEQVSLENAHYRKIELSDAIYVVDIQGYIGNQVLDGELRETQTTDYFSKHRRSDCAVRELTAR